MHWTTSKLSLLFGALAALAGTACQSGGVGDPCVPEDEYYDTFPGYTETQVNVESKSFQCQTRVCLVANFRGRVSCPYGQENATDRKCSIPGSPDPTKANSHYVTVAVPAQLQARQTSQAVYCSCRCAGADPNAKYCDCPSGYVCANIVPQVSESQKELAGSYCIKDGTQVTDPTRIPSGPCSLVSNTCGPPYPDNL